ncbi:hypothetical protein V8C35DRAFT_93867 [Trichoderma chlorosporum]
MAGGWKTGQITDIAKLFGAQAAGVGNSSRRKYYKKEGTGLRSDDPIAICDVVTISRTPSVAPTLAEWKQRIAIELLLRFTIQSFTWDDAPRCDPFHEKMPESARYRRKFSTFLCPFHDVFFFQEDTHLINRYSKHKRDRRVDFKNLSDLSSVHLLSALLPVKYFSFYHILHALFRSICPVKSVLLLNFLSRRNTSPTITPLPFVNIGPPSSLANASSVSYTNRTA